MISEEESYLSKTKLIDIVLGKNRKIGCLCGFWE